MSNATKKAEHPSFSEMVVAALKALKDRTGSSRQAIEKYIKANYKVGDNAGTHLKLALKRMSEKGTILHTKGKGASGSFKLNKEAVEKPKKTVKKPAAKKVAKKPAATKPAAEKPAAKRATKSPKKTESKKPAKKPAAKPKPAAKKATTKKPAANKPATKKPAAKKPAKKTTAKKTAKSPKKN